MPQTAGGTECSGRPPAWVLLDTRARIGCCSRNATTAEARTSDGDGIVVSFSVTDPPALSRCFVHCPNLTAEDFIGEPRVTGADGAVLLIRVTFAPRHGRWKFTDMFVYRAGPGEPSLHLLPRPYPLYLNCDHVGVLSRGDHYSVVVPETRFEAGGRTDYDLYVFSSETMSWSTIVAPVAVDGDTDYDLLAMHYPTKVISIGGVWLAWIDLRRGVLLCNVVDDDRLPEMPLIQLPSLLGANKFDFAPYDGAVPPLRQIRDVTCMNGLLKFVEIEYPDLDELNDTEFRWTATMFTREICSESWDWCCTVDSADLCPTDTCSHDLFPEIWDGKKLTLNKVVISSPTLDLYNDDVFYLMAKLNPADGTNGCVLAVNASDLTLVRVVPFSSDRFDFDPTYQQCAFSKHLSKAPDDSTDARCQLPN